MSFKKTTGQKGKKDNDFVAYTPKRWNNLLNRAREAGVNLEDESSGIVFAEIEDDVVLACLKIIARWEGGVISTGDALKGIAGIRDIVLGEVEPSGDEVLDMMIYSLQVSLRSVFAACECYLEKDFDTDGNVSDLISAASKAESSGDLGTALDCVAQIGAKVLAGEEVSEDLLDGVEDGLVAEWLDGIDALQAAMVGDNSYRRVDEDYDLD